MENIWTLQVGQRVAGNYMGAFPYRGTVTAFRGHTMNHQIALVFVDLDAPIEVFGAERDSLVINASNDAAAASRFSGGIAPDTIEVLN